MFSLKRRKDAFRLLIPKEFIPEEINKKYTKILKSAKSFYTRPIDFLNESIQKVEVLGFQNATIQQQQITRGIPLRDSNRIAQNNFAHAAADINYRSADSFLKLLDRTLNIEFRHTLGNINYFLLLESFMYQYSRDSFNVPEYNFRIDILNEHGASYSAIYLYQPLINGIDMLTFEAGATVAQPESFKCEFKYNNFDYQFVQTDSLSVQVDFDEYLEGIGQKRPWNDPKLPNHDNEDRDPNFGSDSPWENIPGNFPYDPKDPNIDDDDDQVIFDDDGGGVLEDIVHHKKKHTKRKYKDKRPEDKPSNNKKFANLSFNIDVLDVTIGQDFITPALINPDNLDVIYYSFDENIAEVNHLTGIIKLNNPGSVTIVAKSNETENYYAGYAFYILNVKEDVENTEPDVPKVKKDPEISFNIDNLEVTIGDIITELTILNPNHVDVYYYSSNENIVEVNYFSGEIILKNPGTATIIAKSNETEEYYAGNAYCNLVIKEKETELPGETPDKKYPNISFDQSSYVVKIGEEFESPILINPNNLDVEYFATNSEVATISIDGKISLVNPGSTIIIANSKETEDYYAGSASYILVVEMSDIIEMKKSPKISFDQNSYTAKLGEEFIAPVLNNPENLEITYSSTDENVVTIDFTTGHIKLNDLGTTVIVANSKETEDYYAGSASYILIVAEKQLQEDEEGKVKEPDPGSSIEDTAIDKYENSGLAENEKFLLYPYTEENAKKLARFGNSTEFGRASSNSQSRVDENGDPIDYEESEEFKRWQELDFSKFKNT